MTARIYTAGWMLKVRRAGQTRGGDGWPPGPPVTTIEFGGRHAGDSGAPLLRIDTDEAVRDLIAKLQAVLP